MFPLDLPKSLINLQQDCILQWKASGITLAQEGFLKIAEENHAFNYQLWHAEDRARQEDRGYQFVYDAKREIDHCNQQRNNRMEAMDAWLFNALHPSESPTCPIHTETPGMIIDRLSILALRKYHMALQVERGDVDNAHRASCEQKVTTLVKQQRQLQQGLHDLLQEIHHKTRTFVLYHQFKMYNDPAFKHSLSVGEI